MPEQWTLLWQEGNKTWLQLGESSVFFRGEGNYELYGWDVKIEIAYEINKMRFFFAK
jgi:hypothetical protein